MIITITTGALIFLCGFGLLLVAVNQLSEKDTYIRQLKNREEYYLKRTNIISKRVPTAHDPGEYQQLWLVKTQEGDKDNPAYTQAYVYLLDDDGGGRWFKYKHDKSY